MLTHLIYVCVAISALQNRFAHGTTTNPAYLQAGRDLLTDNITMLWVCDAFNYLTIPTNAANCLLLLLLFGGIWLPRVHNEEPHWLRDIAVLDLSDPSHWWDR